MNPIQPQSNSGSALSQPHSSAHHPSNPQATIHPDDISRPPHMADEDPSNPQATNHLDDISRPLHMADEDSSNPQAASHPDDISWPPHVAEEDPSSPQQPQATNQQDRSYPSLPNHYLTSNGTVVSLHRPSLPSGNPGVLATVEQPPPPGQPATADNNIQQEHSGLGLPYALGQVVTASGEQETRSPADNTVMVLGTDQQRQSAPAQGAPGVPPGQAAAAGPQRPLSSSSSPDPFTGERQRGQ